MMPIENTLDHTQPKHPLLKHNQALPIADLSCAFNSSSSSSPSPSSTPSSPNKKLTMQSSHSKPTPSKPTFTGGSTSFFIRDLLSNKETDNQLSPSKQGRNSSTSGSSCSSDDDASSPTLPLINLEADHHHRYHSSTGQHLQYPNELSGNLSTYFGHRLTRMNQNLLSNTAETNASSAEDLCLASLKTLNGHSIGKLIDFACFVYQ